MITSERALLAFLSASAIHYQRMELTGHTPLVTVMARC
jgi:hypothetical protein